MRRAGGAAGGRSAVLDSPSTASQTWHRPFTIDPAERH
jgi:hypothetical protein